MPEEVDVSVKPPMGGVGSFLSDVVSPTVAGVPLTEGVDEVVMDSVPPLVAARGGGGSCRMLLGRHPWPLLRWRPQPTLLGWRPQPTSPAELAGMALQAVAAVALPAELAGMAFPAVAGAASLAIVEVASSTDSMEPAGSPSVCGSQSDCGHLIPDDFVTVPDVVVFPENIELGDPTVVVPPVVRDGMSDTEGRHQDRDLGCTGGQAGIDMGREEQELPRDNNEAIVVGAVGSRELRGF